MLCKEFDCKHNFACQTSQWCSLPPISSVRRESAVERVQPLVVAGVGDGAGGGLHVPAHGGAPGRQAGARAKKSS